MAGIEEAFEKFVTRVSGRERSKAEEPLSKYKSYSEQELLENIEAKRPNQLQSFSLEDYQLNTMPMFEPRDVAPPKSYSPMPNIYNSPRLSQVDLAEGGQVKSYEEQTLNKKGYETKGMSKKEIFDLYDSVMGTFSRRYADGGVASMFRERPGYADGGYTIIDPFSTSLNNAQFQLEKSEDGSYQIIPSGKSIITSEGSYTLPNFSLGEYVLKDFGDRYQLVSAQDLTQPTPAAGYTEEGLRKIAEDTASREQAMANAFNNIPTIDPFSGQQVSAQDQMAFTQPQQDIFPTLNLGSADPLTNIIGSQVGNLSYSEMNALRNRSPNVLSSNVGANLLQALGTGLKDFAYVGDKLGPDYYKNLSGNFFENVKNLDKGFSYDPTYTGADKTGRLDYYKQGIKSLLGMNTPGSNVGGGTPGMRYAIEQISPYLSKTVGPALNILGSAPVTAFGVLDALTGPVNAPEVGKGPEYFRQQLQLPENSPVSRFNQVQDPRTMMSYGGRVSMSNGGLTNTIPPVRGPSPQGVESLFTRRYN